MQVVELSPYLMVCWNMRKLYVRVYKMYYYQLDGVALLPGTSTVTIDTCCSYIQQKHVEDNIFGVDCCALLQNSCSFDKDNSRNV